nr:hypothetical protein [Tanacetum cinerariifolium]
GGQALPGIGGEDAVLERKHAHQIHDGRHDFLEVNHLLVAHRKGADVVEKRERRLVLQGVDGHVVQKAVERLS